MKIIRHRSQKISKNPCFSSSPRLIKQFKQFKKEQNLTSLNPIFGDLYHWFLSLTWPQFFLLITMIYAGVNFLFALIYLTGEDGIANAKPRSLTDAFFFSIQTLSTVGYGSMYPQTLYTQILVTVEILVGLVLMAILTGIMFARFSKPTARVLFSRVAVICPYNGIPTLMFRAANRRDSHILEAQVQVSFLCNEISSEGHQLRRFYDLNLTRFRTPIFGLSWLVMHPIDEKSPLFGKELELLENIDAEIWITLIGIDQVFSQSVHSHYSYRISDIVWNCRFVDIFSVKPTGEHYIDLSRFHDVISM